ncbi:MAG: pyridoxamine 5'-phosphate oxidase family protein [Deltaproteobacteria bacterium]|jgi:nitroimidazol reductase NimA-like FMN-containing flavoprotein (pyridoxamine 5'-phosphate oxidase superfamily)|nr:pyridoxamine 5'-phosphate oxidase family protein [Deltaproteobacteria bacterium]MBW2383226.1 pyridoxamine 5'-phosphate oxidase family protein [Deltaproteobacteria bacterium]MBW2696375.1 pyridoxamine 5'-phosphate oxidase family protein [Deltaproteobacteria bacterium]
MSLKMTKSEREAFLADLHVGVISIAEQDRGPLTAPIWYDYEPGAELWILTGRSSRKGRLLEAAGRFSLVAQTETPPYRYVSVEGPIVSIEKPNLERDERPMAHRYLGKELGDGYIDTTRGDGDVENILVRMRPERWLTVDYSKQFAAD